MDRNCNTTRGGLQVMYRPATGVLGSLIPSSGASMASVMYPELELPGDAGFEWSYWVEDLSTIPTGFFPLADDGSGTRGPYADGVYGPATIALYKYDVKLFTYPFTLTVGSGGGDTTPPVLTGSISITGVSDSGFTATCPVATDNVAVVGYQYRLDGGTWTDIAAGGRMVTFTGQAAGSSHSIDMRAKDAVPLYSGVLSQTVTLAASGTLTGPTSSLPWFTLQAPQDQVLVVGGFGPKDPRAIITVGFDFRRYTSAVANAQLTIVHEGGAADANPDAMKLGALVVVGCMVYQQLQSGVDLCDYTLICEGDATDGSGQHVVMAGRLPVRLPP